MIAHLSVHVTKATAKEGRVTLGLYIGGRGESGESSAAETREASVVPQLPPTTSTVLDALDGAECAWPLPASLRTASVHDARTDVSIVEGEFLFFPYR